MPAVLRPGALGHSRGRRIENSGGDAKHAMHAVHAVLQVYAVFVASNAGMLMGVFSSVMQVGSAACSACMQC